MPISPEVKRGEKVIIYHENLVNLYGCEIGQGTKIGAFVEIQRGAVIGARCKISSHSFICDGVTIGDEVFVGHGVMFTNGRYPRATTKDGNLQTEDDWELVRTNVMERASIGSGAIIICGVTIGENAMVGAGAVVTRSIPPYTLVAGNPARVLGYFERNNPDTPRMLPHPVKLNEYTPR